MSGETVDRGSAIPRRTFLGAVGAATLLPLAGCVLEPPAPTIKPLSCPPLPKGDSATTVGPAVADFEYAYMWNRALADFGPEEITDPDFEVTEVSVSVSEPVIEPADDGFLVWLDSVVADLHFERERGSGRWSAELAASYFVSETECLRAEDDDRVDPRTHAHGRTPVCRV